MVQIVVKCATNQLHLVYIKNGITYDGLRLIITISDLIKAA